jgi:arylsulfatase B
MNQYKKAKAVFILLFAVLSLYAQRNVILIIADDLGADYCGFDISAKDTAKMPNIRSLLTRGVRFSNAWATPYCSSTRACMLTGRYGFRTGVGTVIAGAGSAQLDTAELTIPRLLKKYASADYATANIGKWHLHQQTPQTIKYPNLMGYDHFEGSFIGALNSYTNYTKIKNGITSTVTNYATTETVNNALDWLKSLNGSRPFFLWLAFNAPHTPFHKPPDNLHTVPGLLGTQQHINQNPELYLKAMTEAMDTEIGRLFDWLKQNNRWEQTTILFVGDNGNPKTVSQIADPTQGKGTLNEYGIRVPLLISGPDVVQPGRQSDALFNSTDLFATILDIAGANNWKSGIPAGKPIDAVSQLPILKQQTENIRSWCFSELFTPVPTVEDGKTIRNLDYKLIDFDDGHQEFYHLADDPLEQKDLLKGSLSTIQRTQYITLCAELGNLLGREICRASVPTHDMLDNAGIAIYPNPAGNKVFFTGALPEWMPYKLLDMNGRILAQGSVKAADPQITWPSMPTGFYVLMCHLPQGVARFKLIIE